MLKSAIDVAADLAAGRLERVLPDWASASAPIYALYPSGRYPSAKLRAFLSAMATHLGS
ncbi:hypothetical protein CLG96_14635 [Sphingomonas oleivorans]|uniref:LysR substrate-binding domain-containing protein n=1 Tax=Sphingomonas oleivorans TaxID=1735121 RepID=A0A2T5FVF4_9SPHN|nr:LysR substrate-binding domain-containing protein [Sphingomonas oleivorans]PTQ09427.1 hypothetical protein CLG96_14635 [Sphingomonas oleivorans]